jgi:hypothetical protein
LSQRPLHDAGAFKVVDSWRDLSGVLEEIRTSALDDDMDAMGVVAARWGYKSR